jgi:hypothetical protein
MDEIHESVEKLQSLTAEVVKVASQLKPGYKKPSAKMRKYLLEIKLLSHTMRAEALQVAKKPRLPVISE